MSSLRIENVSKSFDGVQALQGIHLEIRHGEFFSVLGPSGCGKTTLLRVIAGFEKPTTGRIFFDDQDITSVTARMRETGMVFQNYALFPHMTVLENVEFGLRTKHMSKEERRRKALRVLETIHLSDKVNSRIPELSGGEQQRVAVARAIVVEPKVLLFDEPLSNLDVALRATTREEIKALQRRVGITTIYVTHDQSEALGLSDRIALMRGGRIEQMGTPQELYDHPESLFAAEFLGAANMLKGTFDATTSQFRTGNLTFSIPAGHVRDHRSRLSVAIKPEHIHIVRRDDAEHLEVLVETVEYQGFTTNLLLSHADLNLRASCITSMLGNALRPGDRIHVWIDWERCSFFGDL